MQLPTFRYATLGAVKARIPAQLLIDAAITDDQILSKIEEASAMLNGWTEQYFQPASGVVRNSARGDGLLTHPDFLPFLFLGQVASLDGRTLGEFKEMDRIIPRMRHFDAGERGSFYTLQRTSDGTLIVIDGIGIGQQIGWESGSRTIKVLGLLQGFTSGWNNIEMAGWWGWIEDRKYVKTTLAVAIPANTTGVVQVDVASVSDVDTGHRIAVGDTIAIVTQAGTVAPEAVQVAIVQSIAGAGPYQLGVDPLLPLTVTAPIGAEVYCFGRVPRNIVTVTEFLAKQLVTQLAYEVTGNIVGAAWASGDLKSERVDNYSYTLGGVGGGSNGGGNPMMGKHTGSVQMDLLLKKFVKPRMLMRYI